MYARNCVPPTVNIRFRGVSGMVSPISVGIFKKAEFVVIVRRIIPPGVHIGSQLKAHHVINTGISNISIAVFEQLSLLLLNFKIILQGFMDKAKEFPTANGY
jgi:hypothetical protein